MRFARPSRLTILFAVAPVVAGAVTAFLASRPFVAGEMNYIEIDLLDQAVREMTRLGLGYLFGAAVVTTLLSLRFPERAGQPLLVIAGSAAGAIFGLAAAAPLLADTPEPRATQIRIVAGLLTALLVTFLASLAVPDRPSRRGRLILLALSVIGTVIPIIALRYTNDFPHGRPVAMRHQWAKETFGPPYDLAVETVKAAGPVHDSVGNILAVAPAEGMNRVMYGPAETMCDFTLDVKGTSGTGRCDLSLLIPYQKENGAQVISMKWTSGGRTIDLGTATIRRKD